MALGRHHETSPTEISAFSRGRCRAAGANTDRVGISLSDAAGAHPRRLRARRCDRHYGPGHRAVVVGADRPAIRDREPGLVPISPPSGRTGVTGLSITHNFYPREGAHLDVAET